MSPIPAYDGGSIVNLMASIVSALGGVASAYPALTALPPAGLEGARHVVLIVLDGLGYDFLQRNGAGGALHRQLHARITSVAPSTTAAAVTTFLTGLAPQQHGLTGWFTWFRELGSVVAVLPFSARCGKQPLGRAGIDAAALFGHRPVFDTLAVDSYSVAPAWIAHSDFSRAHLGRAGLVPYTDLADCFETIARTVRSGSARKFVYAYWPGFDSLAHDHGVNSVATREHFAEIDAGFERLLDALAGSGSAVLVTADHGFVDVPEAGRISLEDHPGLKDCLMLPLCGEQRFAYAYVRSDRHADFVDYVRRHLSQAAALYRSEELLARHLFGIGEPHPELRSRIGDYSLIMKPGYSISDTLPGEQRGELTGFHGGLSEEEMYVPLAFTVV